MKEIIHFTAKSSTDCIDMLPEIKKFLTNNPAIIYSKIDIDLDANIYDFYSKKYPGLSVPSFIGLVDGLVQDGHVGKATSLILESLVG